MGEKQGTFNANVIVHVVQTTQEQVQSRDGTAEKDFRHRR
jgi:hypothetical protein